MGCWLARHGALVGPPHAVLMALLALLVALWQGPEDGSGAHFELERKHGVAYVIPIGTSATLAVQGPVVAKGIYGIGFKIRF